MATQLPPVPHSIFWGPPVRKPNQIQDYCTSAKTVVEISLHKVSVSQYPSDTYEETKSHGQWKVLSTHCWWKQIASLNLNDQDLKLHLWYRRPALYVNSPIQMHMIQENTCTSSEDCSLCSCCRPSSFCTCINKQKIQYSMCWTFQDWELSILYIKFKGSIATTQSPTSCQKVTCDTVNHCSLYISRK